MDDRTIVFQGELQLQAWGESSTAGAWVKFWIHSDDLEAFKALRGRSGKQAGQRLAVVMVEIGDDEMPVVQPEAPAAPPAASPAPRYQAPHIGALGMLAVRWCKDPAFQRWVPEVKHARDGDRYNESACKEYILAECGITDFYGSAASRKHLDIDPECARRFQERIRGPFMEWKRENGLDNQ